MGSGNVAAIRSPLQKEDGRGGAASDKDRFREAPIVANGMRSVRLSAGGASLNRDDRESGMWLKH